MDLDTFLIQAQRPPRPQQELFYMNKQMKLEGFYNRMKANERERNDLRNYYTSQPVYKALGNLMPFNASHSANSDFTQSVQELFGKGLRDSNAITSLLRRNAQIKEQNIEDIENDEDYQAQLASQAEDGDESQKQSLELYFNELQDGGFGGTDINRENTRKALFNLKNTGLTLSLTTLQRFISIVDEFIDSFILSVNNPQFSELIADGRQILTNAKTIEILKTSLKNLDSIENILRILKVLESLEESINFEPSRREAVFDSTFNDIIEAKPAQYIPDKLRVLLTETRKSFDSIKDNLSGINDIRNNTNIVESTTDDSKGVLDTRVSDLIDSFNMAVDKTFIKFIQDSEKDTSKTKTQLGQEFITTAKSDEYYEHILKQFFKTSTAKKFVQSIIKSNRIGPSKKQLFINLINGVGSAKQNLINISTATQGKKAKNQNPKIILDLSDSFKNEYKRFVELYKSMLEDIMRREGNVANGIPARARRVDRGQAVERKVDFEEPKLPTPKPPDVREVKVPDTTPATAKFLDKLSDKTLKKNMDFIKKPTGKKPANYKVVIKPTTSLAKAQEQLRTAQKDYSRRQGQSQKAYVKQDVDTAQRIVDMIVDNNTPKQAPAEEAVSQADIDEAAKALRFNEDDSDDIDEAGIQEQKGEGKRIPSKQYRKSKGGNKKPAQIDNEHKLRLKALLM